MEEIHKLGMTQTEERNGILFYLAIQDKHFTIVADEGIHAKVPDNFWENIKAEMEGKFRDGAFTEGLCDGIIRAGKSLKQFFPHDGENDQNELPDNISFKDE